MTTARESGFFPFADPVGATPHGGEFSYYGIAYQRRGKFRAVLHSDFFVLIPFPLGKYYNVEYFTRRCFTRGRNARGSYTRYMATWRRCCATGITARPLP